MPEEKVFPSFDDEDTSSNSSTIIVNDDLEANQESPNVKEENNDEMKLSAKMALLDFRCRVEDAILSNYLVYNKKKVIFSKEDIENQRDISLWGVPLLSSKGHEGTDVILMKFLKSKDYKVSEAFKALRKALRWRMKHHVDDILGENFSPEVENLWHANGKDKDGRPVCYQVLGNFKDKDLDREMWGSHEERQDLIRWRIQCLEKGIRLLDFKPGGHNSIVLVYDLRNSPGIAMKEIRWITKRMLRIIHDNYPGLIHKNIIINVPVWFSTLHALNLRVIQQRSKNKFIFVRPTRVTDTLLKYVSAEELMAHYGGLRREKDMEFSPSDKVLEATVKPNISTSIRIPVKQGEMTVTWDLMVVGYEVAYKEEFIPEDDCSYSVLLQSNKKMETLIRNSFHIREPGNIVITIHNHTSKKKMAFYRYHTKPSIPIYMLQNCSF
ncbi:unnamed protein product [Cuscuta epithymum]|uniref:CRAL-TRIO domain-containing protein n=1 Tax=Cuscuta epithymum TaxID=186058 RepID=A0AAV0F1U8_9ASTE|nr:unnamed protein product [Cuscuta epithymum]